MIITEFIANASLFLTMLGDAVAVFMEPPLIYFVTLGAAAAGVGIVKKLGFPSSLSVFIGIMISVTNPRSCSLIYSCGSFASFILEIIANISSAASVYLKERPEPTEGKNSRNCRAQSESVVRGLPIRSATSTSEYVRLNSIISTPMHVNVF